MYLFYRGENFNPNFYYFSKVDIDHSFLLVDGTEKILLVPKMNAEVANKEFAGEVIVYQDLKKDLKKIIKGRKVFVDETNLTVSIYRFIKSIIKCEFGSEKLAQVRSKKNSVEISKVKKAVSITKELLEELDFSKFNTEISVKKHLLMQTLEMDLEPAFRPIVATNPSSRFPHYESKDSKLKDMVLVDYGVKYEYYCSDLTRCFFLKRGTEMEKTYLKLQDMFNDMMDDFSNFSNGKEIAEFQEKLFKHYNLPKPVHSIGHGVGLEVHEYPRLGKKSKDILKNTILAVEPGAYFGNYGVRFEETLFFDGEKARVL